MQAIDLKELMATSGVKEEDVKEAVDLIRQVERLGGTRADYNLVPPFSRFGGPAKMGRPTDPRTVKLQTRRH